MVPLRTCMYRFFPLYKVREPKKGGGGGAKVVTSKTPLDPPLPLFNKDKGIAIEHAMKKVLGSPKVKLQQNVDPLLF